MKTILKKHKKKQSNPIFSDKNRDLLCERKLKQAKVENKELLELANMYIHFGKVGFDTANPLLNLCHYHNLNPRLLDYMQRDSSAYLIRELKNSSIPNKKEIVPPKQYDYQAFNLEEVILSHKLLKTATESIDLQDFYNKSKLNNLVQSSLGEKLFDNISGHLTGVKRHFIYQHIDKSRSVEDLKLDYYNY